jgi:hypothetical protein
MIDAPRPRRRFEVFEVDCWRCRRTIQLPVSAPPYHCPHCSAALDIEWGERPLFWAAPAASDPKPEPREPAAAQA